MIAEKNIFAVPLGGSGDMVPCQKRLYILNASIWCTYIIIKKPFVLISFSARVKPLNFYFGGRLSDWKNVGKCWFHYKYGDYLSIYLRWINSLRNYFDLLNLTMSCQQL